MADTTIDLLPNLTELYKGTYIEHWNKKTSKTLKANELNIKHQKHQKSSKITLQLHNNKCRAVGR